MDNNSDNIDELINQIDTIDPEQCCYCHSNTNFSTMLTLSCSHQLCLCCTEELVNQNNINQCPTCHINLITPISQLFSNPLIKLEYHHNILPNEMVWAYKGQNHNWLYTKDISDQIEEAYKIFDEDDSQSKINIIIKTNGVDQIYVVDFSSMAQYPKKFPHKKRNIFPFMLKSKKDLDKNRIIGVAGNLL